MKVVAICGSPRRQGNTERAIGHALKPIKAAGIETKLITLAKMNIEPCIACGGCSTGPRCTPHKDDFQDMYDETVTADGLILASPVYFGCATGPICNFMHRLGYVARRNGNPLSRKVGGAIAVARRAGQNATFAQLSMFFSINDMVQVGSTYWNVLIGREVGDVEHDEEGVKTMTRFGENMAWALERLRGA